MHASCNVSVKEALRGSYRLHRRPSGVRFEEDTTLSASVSFGGDGGSDNGGDDSGGSDGAPVVSGDGNDDKSGGSADDADGATQDSSSPAASVLPATGGVLRAAALGALLIAAGLIARRIYR